VKSGVATLQQNTKNCGKTAPGNPGIGINLCIYHSAHHVGLALRATGAVVGIVGLAMPQSGGDGDARIAAPGCNMSVGEDHVLARPAGTCHAAKRTLIVMSNRGVRVGVPSGGVFKLAAANQGRCRPVSSKHSAIGISSTSVGNISISLGRTWVGRLGRLL